MKFKIKQQKGITMISLIIVIIILLIVTNILIYNAKDSIHIKALTNLYNDIELLQEKVAEYYNKYGKIPAKIKYTNTVHLLDILSKNNDIGDFYVIDLEAMQGITLNYGKDYEAIKNDETNINNYIDVYVINENSHNIFYIEGIKIQENNEIKTYYTNYTQPDETTVDLRYIDGILIPEGYYYIGNVSTDNGQTENIVISKNKNEEINDTSEEQYIWQKQISNLEKIPDTIKLEEGQIEDEFFKSVNHYKGYFKNKNKTQDIDIIYLTIEENKWSEQYEEIGKYIDKNGDIAYIPKGFRVSLAEGTNEIRNGLVITDKIDENRKSTGNEFVWIPVDYFEEFKREEFEETTIAVDESDKNTENQEANNIEPKEEKVNEITNQSDTELETKEEYNELTGDGKTIDETAEIDKKEAQEIYKSVKEYKGFYIGRYEAGIDVNEPRLSISGTDDEVVIKKNKYIYNYITWGKSLESDLDGAVEKARNMYENSTLCYGVQWDAILKWINKDYSINYILKDSTEKGNYDQSGKLIKSGSNENNRIKNIYDLAGNVAEWTMEGYGTTKKVARGGKSGSTDSITTREPNLQNTNDGLIGFRVALYIK